MLRDTLKWIRWKRRFAAVASAPVERAQAGWERLYGYQIGGSFLTEEQIRFVLRYYDPHHFDRHVIGGRCKDCGMLFADIRRHFGPCPSAKWYTSEAHTDSLPGGGMFGTDDVPARVTTADWS